jgi:hypothetical protein
MPAMHAFERVPSFVQLSHLSGDPEYLVSVHPDHLHPRSKGRHDGRRRECSLSNLNEARFASDGAEQGGILDLGAYYRRL